MGLKLHRHDMVVNHITKSGERYSTKESFKARLQTGFLSPRLSSERASAKNQNKANCKISDFWGCLPVEIRGIWSGVVQRRDHAVDWPRSSTRGGSTTLALYLVPAHFRGVLFQSNL